jgi:tRNA A37 methylthiotransferase MiaB
MQEKTKKFNVLLVQLPHPSCPDRNVPLAAGYLKAASFQEGLLENINVEILDSLFSDYAGCHMLTEVILKRKPDAIGFSLYLWNIDRSLHIINNIKTKRPNIKIIVGGAEVTRKAKAIISNPNIDIAVFGEGEKTFVEVLKNLTTGQPKLENIIGIGYRKNKKKFIINKPRPRITDINSIPSPYLLGYLDPQKHREVLLSTMRGCMLGCSYCSWTASGKLTAFNLQRLEQELLLARKAGRPITISLIDSALNTSPIFIDFCKLVEKVNKDGLLKFNCFVQADLINESEAKLMKKSGFNSVEVGLQSANPEVLAKVNRRVKLDRFLKGVQTLKKEGITVGVDVIVGLPGDSPSSFDETMNFLSENNLNPMIFQLSISKGARIAAQIDDFQGKVQPYPPYYIKQTKAFSKKELQQTFCRYREKYSDLDRIINLNYPAILLSPLSPTDCWDNPVSRLQDLNYPIRSIVLQCCPHGEKMKELAQAISNKVSNSLTILFDYSYPSDGSIEMLLKEIYSKNQHIHCLLLFENNHGEAKRIKKFVQKQRRKIFLDHRDEIVSKYLPDTHRRSTNIFEIYDGVIANKQTRQFKITEISIGCLNDKKVLQEQLMDRSNRGFLINFSSALPIKLIRDCMELMIASGKEVFFKDWVIQRLWEQEYLKITPAPQPAHYQILIDKNSQVYAKCFDETDLLWDSINKWKMIRKEYEGADLEKVILEKAMAIIAKNKRHYNNGA